MRTGHVFETNHRHAETSSDRACDFACPESPELLLGVYFKISSTQNGSGTRLLIIMKENGLVNKRALSGCQMGFESRFLLTRVYRKPHSGGVPTFFPFFK